MRKTCNEVPDNDIRFAFGENWARFLRILTPGRVAEAEKSLSSMLWAVKISEKTFLDIGSGSGLFSLAARNLGAVVHSFDCDAGSFACTTELKERYHPGDAAWIVETGSILDNAYVAQLGQFDVVYSWGVLHHTGALWDAMGNAARLIRPGGIIYIAIYNTQPFLTAYWKTVKRFYSSMPKAIRWLMEWGFFLFFMVESMTADLVRGRNPFNRFGGEGFRGMNMRVDVRDWIGGWPFETARPEEVFHFFRDRNFELLELVTVAGKHGCNEFVFRRKSETS